MQASRDIMGATNAKGAAAVNNRAHLAESIEANAVHASGSGENAAIEIVHFSSNKSLLGKPKARR